MKDKIPKRKEREIFPNLVRAPLSMAREAPRREEAEDMTKKWKGERGDSR